MNRHGPDLFRRAVHLSRPGRRVLRLDVMRRAVDKSPKRWIECLAAWSCPPESTPSTEQFSARSLTGTCFWHDDTRAVLLFLRLRSLLFELCRDHPVAVCETCRRAYTPEQLGTEIGNACYLCRHCGADLRASVATHARTCPNLTPQKPLALMASVTSSTNPSAAPSERFATRRNTRLGLDTQTTTAARVR
jgi:hypothetical protein